MVDSPKTIENNEPKNQKQLLQWWKDEIKAGVRYRTVYGGAKRWTAYKNMYRGHWQRGVVPVNMIYAVGRSVVPQVYFRNPKVYVSAKKPGYIAHAMVLDRVDNHLIKETGLKYQLKSNTLDSYLMGRGPGVLGYDSEYGFNPSFTIGSEFEDSGLTQFGKKGEQIEYTDEVKPGMPWYLRVSPEDFIVPWGTRRLEEARWFAFRKMRPLRDVKESPLYTNKGNLKGAFHTKLEGSLEGISNTPTRHLDKDGENEWVELFEIHDKRTGKVFALSLDHDSFLRIDDDELQIEGLPARAIGFNEDPDYFWWTPDARLIEVQQAEINDIRTMAKMHRRIGLLKGLYDKNAIKPEEMAKFLDEDPKAFAGVDVGPQGDIRKTVAYIQSHVPPDLISYAREVREDVREIVGFSRNQMGSFEESSGRRTAHEAEIVRAASAIRIDERRDIMADHLESVIRGYNQIVFKNWSSERIVDIVGQDGARYWVRFTGEEIKGEFHYKIDPEEALPQDQRTRRQDAKEFMQIAATIPGVDMQYLVKQYSRQFDWLDPSMLVPQSEGAGRSPEKALLFSDFVRRTGQGQSRFGGLNV
jgi:hypothetical protein